MFAHVYPIMRLPRRFGVFDYRIPEGLVVAPGALVRVPFHHRQILALVAAVDDVTEVRGELAEVAGVTVPFFADARRYEVLAHDIAQSVPALLYATFGALTGAEGDPRTVRPPAAPQRYQKDVVATIGAALQSAAPRVAVQTSIEGTCLLIQKLRERHTQQVLIVCPLERDVDCIARAVPLGERAAVLHGKTSPKERERILTAWREGRIRTLVGTRQAALFPAQHLDAIVITASGNDQHFNDRRNPRLDARNAAWLLAEEHSARLYACDPLPRPEETTTHTLVTAPPATCTVIDLKNPEENSDVPLVASSTLAAIKSALQSGKKVLLFLNRKGVAKRAQCRNCHTVLTCHSCGAPWGAGTNDLLACPRCRATAALPEACPSCEHGRVSLRGIGNAHVEASLAAALPGVRIARVEKGVTTAEADVILATEYYWTSVHTPFAPKQFGLVAELCLDLTQRLDDFRSSEHTARALHRLAHLAQQQSAPCIVQTFLAPPAEAMRDASAFLTEERSLRTAYHLPPASAFITVRHASPEAIAALTGATFVPNEAIMGCEGRIPYDRFDAALGALTPLPDTAVISVDYHYGNLDRPHLRKS